ncbi:hypothetical protein ACLX1H_008947 [Fusarium chlamydosporum]
MCCGGSSSKSKPSHKKAARRVPSKSAQKEKLDRLKPKGPNDHSWSHNPTAEMLLEKDDAISREFWRLRNEAVARGECRIQQLAR